MSLFLFSPVLHPWYLIWPLIFMNNNKYYYFFIFSSSFLAYHPYGLKEIAFLSEGVQLIFLSLAIRNNLKQINESIE